MTGAIMHLVKDKGFGFIRDAEGRERFFHARDLVGVFFDQLQEQDPMEFVAASNGKGGNKLNAEQVRRVAR